MSKNKEYNQAIEHAETILKDAKERGNEALCGTWAELRKEIYTPEEIAASDLRVSMMLELVNARQERGIQKKLEELSGVKQPIIARMEKGHTSPQLDTILKVLAPLGKTLYIGNLQKQSG